MSERTGGMMAGSSPQPDTAEKPRASAGPGASGKGSAGSENLLYLERRTHRAPFRHAIIILSCILLLGALGVLFFLSERQGQSALVVAASVASVILGALVLWLNVRVRLARSLAHVENFRRRLMSVERDQALWISLSAVLHDVRNPMHNVTLLAEALGGPGANVSRMREQMLAELERVNVRMRRVRQQIAHFSGDIQRRTVSLLEILNEVQDMIAPLAARSGVAFAIHCAPHFKVVVDPKVLVQAVDHLLLNSLQILDEQPPEKSRRLSVSVLQEAEAVSLLIEDTGPGLPEAVRSNPFEPLGTSTRQGMGLGLTIAHALVRSSGGELSVAHTGASGTQFRLRLMQA